MLSAPSPARRARGFTILELLTATAILAAILVMVFSVLSHSIGIWRQANAKIDAFQNARAVFEIMTSRLSQATLNTYWDYYDAGYQPFRLATNSANFVPKYYGRCSDLHFVCGPATSLIPTQPPGYSALAAQAVFFTVPTGLTTNTNYQAMPGLLSACGFFVAFGGDDVTRPAIVSSPVNYRWHLMELTAPAESLGVFASPTGTDWFTTPIANGQVRPLADNIIALVIWPRLAPLNDPAGTNIAPNYAYDSRTTAAWSGTPPAQPLQSHQLPPTVQVTMVAIDEASAIRMQTGSTPPPQITAALSGRFVPPVTAYPGDLQQLEQSLAANHINYRVFTTTVAMRESRWSQ